MEMHQIRYFLEVAETLNFTRAAENCHVAQPSLSRAIRKLEEELGGDLFRRERNRTHLTDLGRAMRPFLRQAYESAVTAKEQAVNYKGTVKAPLRVGLSHTVHIDLIARIIEELGTGFPGLELTVVRDAGREVLGALETGDIELAVAAETDSDWNRLDAWPLFEEGFVVVAQRSNRSPRVSLAELDPSRVIGRPYCETLDAGASHPARRIEVSNDDDAVCLASGGMGFAVVPESSAHRSGVASAALKDLDLRRLVRVCAVSGRQRSPQATAMLRLLRAADWVAATAGWYKPPS